jgi:hypothetical protein
MMGIPQPITGPLINLVLFLTVLLLDIKAAVLVGILTPIIALWRGQLPPILTPMVPFIMLGNAVLVIFFGLGKKILKNSRFSVLFNLLAVIVSSFFKFLIIYSSARIVVPLLFGVQFSEKILVMMALPQFITALVGGFIAISIFNFFRRLKLAN